MAFRIHVIAAEGATADDWRAARAAGGLAVGGLAADGLSEGGLATEKKPHALGDWQVAVASVWGMSGSDARWLAGLISRRSHGRALVATTVDDVLVELSLQRDGRVLTRLELPYGGVGGGADSPGEVYVSEAGGDFDADEPLSEEVRSALATLMEEDPEEWDAVTTSILERILAGEAPLAARAAATQAEVDAVLASLGALDWPLDRVALRRVLDGRALAEQPDAWEEALPAWADTPELLESLGVPGVRQWLLEKAAREEEQDAAEAARASTAEDAAARSNGEGKKDRSGAGRIAGCLGLILLALAFAGGGAWLGQEFFGAVGGLLGGGAGLVVVLGGAGVVLWLKLRALKTMVLGADDPARDALLQSMAALPRHQAQELNDLLATWSDLADRVGVDGEPRGLIGMLDPASAALGQAPARSLVKGLIAGAPVDPVRRRLSKLRCAVLDIELNGGDPHGARPELEALTESVD